MRHFFFTLITLLMLTGCSRHTDSQSTVADSQHVDSLAIEYYQLRAQGRFADYVTAMQSCDGTTPDYKKRIEAMLRQHQATITKEKKGVNHVSVLRTEMHNGGKMANVYLSVTYNDGTREEVLFPLVHDGQSWRIQ